MYHLTVCLCQNSNISLGPFHSVSHIRTLNLYVVSVCSPTCIYVHGAIKMFILSHLITNKFAGISDTAIIDRGRNIICKVIQSNSNV